MRSSQLRAILLTALLSLLGAPLHAQPAATNAIYLPFVARDCTSGLSIHSTDYGRWWNSFLTTYLVVGEVVNSSSTPVYSVTVSLRLFDIDTQQPLTSENQDQVALLPEILPGAANPFKIEWSNVPSWRRISWDLHATCVATSAQAYAPVTVLSRQIDTATNPPRVTGVVRNDQRTTLTAFRAAVSVVQSDGSFLDTGSYSSSAPLLPGATAPYTITLGGNIFADYTSVGPSGLRVQAQGAVGP
jgi:hypothetical protein